MEYPAENVTANVPVEVTGDPLTDSPVGTLIPTDVTVPVLLVYPFGLVLLYGVKPSAVVIFDEVNVDQTGAAPLVPVPVCDKNFIVELVFGLSKDVVSVPD
jgi:hypothetical protein